MIRPIRFPNSRDRRIVNARFDEAVSFRYFVRRFVKVAALMSGWYSFERGGMEKRREGSMLFKTTTRRVYRENLKSNFTVNLILHRCNNKLRIRHDVNLIINSIQCIYQLKYQLREQS